MCVTPAPGFSVSGENDLVLRVEEEEEEGFSSVVSPGLYVDGEGFLAFMASVCPALSI